MSPPTALITGIIGHDGSHPADFLLAKGYRETTGLTLAGLSA